MILTDNDYKMDDDIIETMEESLLEYLEGYREDEWFTLRHLYETLEIKFTSSRDGSLDKIIHHTLDEWNWHRHQSRYWGLSYIRNSRPIPLKEITFVNGTSIMASESWPPYRLPEPSAERMAQLEETRQKLLKILARARTRNRLELDSRPLHTFSHTLSM